MTVPTSAASVARKAEETRTDAESTAKTTLVAGVVSPAITAIEGALSSLPVGVVGTLLASAIYAFLSLPPLPVDFSKMPPGTPKDRNDPMKLFALMLALAILMMVWCFIKSLLNPMPIIGSFFPLCDQSTQPGGTAGLIVLNFDKAVSEDAMEKVNTAIVNITAGKTANNPKLVLPVVPAVSEGPSGITFAEFVASTPAGATGAGATGAGATGGADRSTGTTNTSANVAQPVTVDYAVGNLSSDQIRRLFGL